jgi:hypothetical protein
MSETIYQYEIRIANQAGVEIKTLVNFSHLTLARVVSGVGNLELKLPGWTDFDLFKPDSRIAVYRSIAGEPLKLVAETIFIVVGRKRIREKKQKYLVITAKDANLILERHIIAYNSGTTEAQKTDQIDDMMKEIVRENIGADCVEPARTIDEVTIASNTSTAPSISKSFSRKNLLQTLQELAQASYSTGTYLAFDLIAYDVNSFEFRTYPNVRGVDKRYEGNVQPVIIDADLNLGDLELDENYESNINFIYVGGQGEGAERTVTEREESTRNYSNIGRVEKFIDARNANTGALLTAEALTALRNYRPRISFKAEFIQTKNLLFGRDINFGDYLPVQVDQSTIIDCRLDAFKLEIDGNGQETVTIILRADN